MIFADNKTCLNDVNTYFSCSKFLNHLYHAPAVPANYKIPDPIHGHLDVPDWLIEIENSPPIRRMLSIRQLGLKSIIDFPGAIHTRYGHALGAMHLSGLLVDRLSEKIQNDGRSKIAENLKNNKNNLMAAGLLHDIAHGPFSHAVDFVLRQASNITHEKLAERVICNDLAEPLTNHGITPESVVKIINNTHDFKFVSGIINGPIDIDKLDYLLRDAHHVGLKYSFDLEHFVGSYTVLGDDNELNKCMLGLENTRAALVTSEIFVLIWKSMYDLVYHVQDSRIAEKMLEKATLLGIDEDDELKQCFTDQSTLLTLDDDKLLHLLNKSKHAYTRTLEEKIRNRKLFVPMNEIMLYGATKINPKFLSRVTAATSYEIDHMSDRLSSALSSELGLEKYHAICDIVKSRSPSDIFMRNSESDAGEPENLREKSDIIKEIKQRTTMRIYMDPAQAETITEDLLLEKITTVIDAEAGV